MSRFLVGGVNVGGTPTSRFDGWIDEVQLYDSALSQADVEFLFANPGSVVPEPGPALLLFAGVLVLLARLGRLASKSAFLGR